VKIGVILVVAAWLNDALVEELERQGGDIRVVCFGCRKKALAAIRAKHGARRVSAYGGSAFRTRKYAAAILRELQALRSSGAEYFLCLHGDAALIENLDGLFAAIRENPGLSLMENHPRPPGREGKIFYRRHVGGPAADKLVNALFRGIDSQRYKTMGFHYGHDAWGLSAAAVGYLLASPLTPYMYRLCKFSLNARLFFFHTLAYHSCAELSHSSPERHAAERLYTRYHTAYRDHAATLLAEGPGLFYPASPSAPLFSLPGGRAQSPPGDGGRSPYRPYPASRPPCGYNLSPVFGALPHIPKAFFALYFFRDCAIGPLVTALNDIPGTVCNGDLFSWKGDKYARPEHACPRYPADRPIPDSDAAYAAFVSDLLYFYHDRRFGFLLPIGESRDWNAVWSLPNCQGVFILPDVFSSLLDCALTLNAAAGKNFSFVPALSAWKGDVSLAEARKSPAELAALLALFRIRQAPSHFPLFLPESLLRDAGGIQTCVRKIRACARHVEETVESAFSLPEPDRAETGPFRSGRPAMPKAAPC
jgi:hypothetical protein